MSRPFPHFYSFSAISPSFQPSLVVVDKGPSPLTPAVLRLRPVNGVKLEEVGLSREDALGIIGSLCQAVGIVPPELAT